jgi:hypothetical protein
MDRSWRSNEVARYLNVSRPRVQQLVREGKLPLESYDHAGALFDPERVRTWAATWVTQRPWRSLSSEITSR